MVKVPAGDTGVPCGPTLGSCLLSFMVHTTPTTIYHATRSHTETLCLPVPRCTVPWTPAAPPSATRWTRWKSSNSSCHIALDREAQRS